MLREKQVRKYMEEESCYFYERVEQLQNKQEQEFCGRVIDTAIADAYDFFCYEASRYNIFYKNIHTLNKCRARKIYKSLSMYHLLSNKDCIGFMSSTAFIFLWTIVDNEMFEYFFQLKKECRSQFYLEFSRYVIGDVWARDKVDPMTLAFVYNLFYNSHKGFCAQESWTRVVDFSYQALFYAQNESERH